VSLQLSSQFSRSRLSQELEQALRSIVKTREFRKGETLYRHGSIADGLFVVETGAVQVLLPTGDHHTQVLEVVGTGAILGLSETMSGDNYRVTANAEELTTTSFIDRIEFLEFLDGHPEFCMQIVRLLSENLHGLYHKFRSVSAHPGRPRRRRLNEA
jgi:CRP-like cAMP-binding protein